MRLEPLYTVRFRYPDGWEVPLDGPGGHEELHYYFAEEVRVPVAIPADQLKQADVELVFEVSELVWEAPAD